MDHDGTEGYTILGDVFVCPETAVDYANTHDLAPYHELSLYIVHGLLHLMGYDDILEEDRNEMRKAEEKHMKHLKKKGSFIKGWLKLCRGKIATHLFINRCYHLFIWNVFSHRSHQRLPPHP